MNMATRMRARRLVAAIAPPAVPDDTAEVAADLTDSVIAVESATMATGDGRRIDPGALRADVDVPIPILWDRDDGDHTGVVVGHYDPATFTRLADGTITVSGMLGPTRDPDTAAAIGRIVELLEANNIGQSVMLDTMSGHTEAMATRDDADDEWSHDDVVDVVTSARIRHVALVDTPAMPEARPVLASAGRLYPADHFAQWTSPDPVPFTVEPDGRVWGHAAGTGCHRSAGRDCLLYSADVDPTMQGFHTSGRLALDNGDTVRVGPVTFGGLHADTSMTAEQRRQHHENGSTTVALVRAWDDDRGRLAVAGTLVSGLDDTTVDQLRGCAPSYERWPEGGGLTLLGLHLVPRPAHPVATAASAGGPVVAVDCLCDERRCKACAGDG